jgi:stage II sporulation protein D
VSNAVEDAVRSTAGETLWFKSERAQVFFSGSCGGTTESAGSVWPTLIRTPYLKSIADPYCVRKDHAAWHGELPLSSLLTIATHEGWHVPQQIVSAKIAERTSSQRTKTIALIGSNGEAAIVSASALRLAVGRSLGWNILRSDAYEVRLRGGVLVFDGRGHGHGVGLCQQGATEMARMGKAYREILGFYFPGTVVRVTRLDEGWKQSSLDGITFMSTSALTTNAMREAVDAWNFAKSNFPPRQPTMPTVTFAPTTEIFRQMTAQPGWQVASTSGSAVVLQPSSVIQANHVSLATTLRHEMLHVAIEASSNANTPLWLREGLVEVLAGDATHATPSLSADDTERLLHHAGSWQQSRSAHQAAGARTRLLVERYGMSAVRGWMLSGSAVPKD